MIIIDCNRRKNNYTNTDELHLSEEVVFDEMVNEVSIVDDEQNKNQHSSTAVQTSNDNRFIQQTIKSPVNTDRVTSIRNVTPNTKTTANQKTPSGTPNKVVNNIVLTPKNQSQLKTRSQTGSTPPSASKSITIQSNKQSPSQATTIPTTTNQQILTKVITTGGQQLLITSPVKQGKSTHTTETKAILTNDQEKQQLIDPLSISAKAPFTLQILEFHVEELANYLLVFKKLKKTMWCCFHMLRVNILSKKYVLRTFSH